MAVKMSNEELIALALEAREGAYAPYSNWKVGAALLCRDGSIFKGCNIENSGFSATYLPRLSSVSMIIKL